MLSVLWLCGSSEGCVARTPPNSDGKPAPPMSSVEVFMSEGGNAAGFSDERFLSEIVPPFSSKFPPSYPPLLRLVCG